MTARRTKARTVRARYVGPTETRGSRIVVRYLGQQSSQPFRYEARDQFLWAIEQAFGLQEHQLRGVPGRNPDVKVFAVVDDSS